MDMVESHPEKGTLSSEGQAMDSLPDVDQGQDEAQEGEQGKERYSSEPNPDQQLLEEARHTEECRAVTEDQAENRGQGTRRTNRERNDSATQEENLNLDTAVKGTLTDGRVENPGQNSAQTDSFTPYLARPGQCQSSTTQPEHIQPLAQPQQYHSPYLAPYQPPYQPPPQSQPYAPPLPVAQELKTRKDLWDVDRQRREAREATRQVTELYQTQAQYNQGQAPGPPPLGHHLLTTPDQQLQPTVRELGPISDDPRRGRKGLAYTHPLQPRPIYTILPNGSGPQVMTSGSFSPPQTPWHAQPPRTLAPASLPAPAPSPERRVRRTPRQYTDKQRQKVWDLRREGLTHEEIACRTGVLASSVPYILKRMRDKGGQLLPPSHQPEGGGQPIMKESDFRHLMSLIEKDPTLTARELKEMSGWDYSIHTIERQLEKREVERNPTKNRRRVLKVQRLKAIVEGRLPNPNGEPTPEDPEPKTRGDLYRILDGTGKTTGERKRS